MQNLDELRSDSNSKLAANAQSKSLDSTAVDDTNEAKRHWASMRLFYMLLALTATCIFFGLWIGPAYKQAGIIDRIESVGGHVICLDNMSYPPLGDKSGWIRKTFGSEYLDFPQSVSIIDTTPDSNAIFRSIAGLNLIEEVRLNGSSVSDESVKAFSHLKHLKRLELEATEITGDALEILGNCHSLEFVNITCNSISTDLIARFVENSNVDVSCVLDYEIQFFDENKRLTLPPLKIGVSYTVGIKAKIAKGCMDANTKFLELSFDVPHQNKKSKWWLGFGEYFDPLTSNKLAAGTIFPAKYRIKGSMNNTSDLQITLPCTIKMELFRTNSSGQRKTWKTIDIPFEN